MFNQVRIAVELLRLMISGEHPVDLKLVRFCNQKLHCASKQCGSDLMSKVELLDQAQLFNAPPSLLRILRRDALQTLAGVASGGVDD